MAVEAGATKSGEPSLGFISNGNSPAAVVADLVAREYWAC